MLLTFASRAPDALPVFLVMVVVPRLTGEELQRSRRRAYDSQAGQVRRLTRGGKGSFDLDL